MKTALMGTTMWLLALGGLAWGAPPASLIDVSGAKGIWELGVAPASGNGEVALFASEPVYDEEGNLAPDGPVPSTLAWKRGQAGTAPLTLDPARKRYWILFCPYQGGLDLSLTLGPRGAAPADQGTLRVVQGAAKDGDTDIVAVTATPRDGRRASLGADKDQFETFAGHDPDDPAAAAEPAPFLTLK